MAHDDAQPLSVAGSVPIMERLLNEQTLATAIRRGCSVDAGTIDANSLKMIDGAIDVAEMSLATFVKVQDEGFPEGPRMHRSQDFQIPQWRSAHTTSERMFFPSIT